MSIASRRQIPLLTRGVRNPLAYARGSEGPCPPRSRQGPRLHRTRAPSIAECSLPLSHERLRACAWDHEEPATGFAARVLVAFATATRLPTPVRPPEPVRLSATRQGARPVVFRPLDRAPLVDFCNQRNLRARPRGSPDSRLPGAPCLRAGLCAYALRGFEQRRSRSSRDSRGRLPAEFSRARGRMAPEANIRRSSPIGFRRRARPRPQLPLRARASELYPARSARTPLVVRSGRRRLEGPTRLLERAGHRRGPV